jgi:hypothetical protein
LHDVELDLGRLDHLRDRHRLVGGMALRARAGTATAATTPMTASVMKGYWNDADKTREAINEAGSCGRSRRKSARHGLGTKWRELFDLLLWM